MFSNASQVLLIAEAFVVYTRFETYPEFDSHNGQSRCQLTPFVQRL